MYGLILHQRKKAKKKECLTKEQCLARLWRSVFNLEFLCAIDNTKEKRLQANVRATILLLFYSTINPLYPEPDERHRKAKNSGKTYLVSCSFHLMASCLTGSFGTVFAQPAVCRSKGSLCPEIAVVIAKELIEIYLNMNVLLFNISQYHIFQSYESESFS